MIVSLSFEVGPIRPPSEARSLLLRVTRNCSWNRCLFCATYKDERFERRSVDEVKADIDTVVEIIKTVKSLSWQMGLSGQITPEVANYFLQRPGYHHSFGSVVAWLYYNTGSVFLQDANNLILGADQMVKMLEYLNEKIPGISRITTYSRSQTVAGKDLEDLKRIGAAGLNRVHIGLESGSDRVLALMRKGVKAEGHIRGGRNVIEAGMELSEYYMPGLGGQEMWKEHALESARVLNAINPHFIRLRTLHVRQNMALHGLVASGDFRLRTPDETVEEIRLFIEGLEGITGHLASDHIGNMLQDVEGKLPEDKPRMLAAIDRYLALAPEERLHYRVGRLMGVYAGVRDMAMPQAYRQVEESLDKLKDRYKDSLEDHLTELHARVMR